MRIEEFFTKENLSKLEIFNKDGEERKLFEALQTIKGNKLVVFYGAGVSMLGGCKSWVGLAQQLVKDLTSEGVFSYAENDSLYHLCEHDPKRVITICFRKSEKDGFTEIYWNSISGSVQLDPQKRNEFMEIHQLLFDLNAFCYVTTNIDEGIKEIKDRVGLLNREIIDLTSKDKDINLLTRKIGNGNIFYLHGSKSNLRNTIFQHQNYYEFYSRPIINQFLREIFKEDKTVLFVGYGLNDYEILQNIFLAIDRKKTSEFPIHYMLSPYFIKGFSQFLLDKLFFESFSVKVIPYFIDYKNYYILKDILTELKNISQNQNIEELINKIEE